MAAIHDLITLDAAKKFTPLMLEELRSVFEGREDEAWADPDSFTPSTTPLLEAFVRESIRYSPTLATIIPRVVVPEDGVMLPNGVTLPKGTLLSAPIAFIAKDERHHVDPSLFDPFRFLEELAVSGRGAGPKPRRYTLRKDTDSMSGTNDLFLEFGHGRNAW
jgi:cytochrome P450